MSAPGSAAIRGWLVDRVAGVLGVPAASVDTREPLRDLGLSSRELTSVAADLARHLDRTLAPELIWKHPTVDALADALAGAPAAATPVATPERGPVGGPVAVVGLGCRFPGGADSPAAFHRLLTDGTDAIGTVPVDRWETFATAEELADVPRRGGFLDDALDFDAAFFGITPREAATMDPQQRVLLEVAWAALEHAGIAPSSLRGTRTGVFVGMSASEYGRLTMQDLRAVEPWAGTGASAGLAANRLSYVLDLRGPSVTVDTACSSSLVALHQAVVSLQRGECDTALVAGVNLQLSGSITAAFGKLGALAADGRCKPFAAGADGIGRGEGCGVVVLRPLAAARRARDRVLAVVRGTAVNSDGRSNGITAPNPLAQESLLREACQVAGLQPGSLDYVECHGTGTPLGDPIEASALGAVLGAGRDTDRPLLIGSVKSNIGHLEGAAGIAGFIKVVLAMGAGQLPATLHHDAPHPGIDFDGLRLRVVTDATPWPRYSGTARAGVSAFGFGGTNAHVVVEEWPGAATRRPARTDGRPRLFPLSAATQRSLRTRAGDLATWLDSPAGRDADLDAVAATLTTGRDHLGVRAVALASDRPALISRLTAIADGAAVPEHAGNPGGVAFVFSGYGSQWTGMGSELLTAEPAFRDEIAALDPVYREVAGFSLREAVASGDPLPDLASTQLVLMGIQLAQAALWRAHGVEPVAVIGHSMGEVGSAVAAGSLDVAAAVRVMATRARLLTGIDTSGTGAMAMVELSAAELGALADRFPGVGIAVHGSPGQCTVSGPEATVAALVDHVEGLGRLGRLLPVKLAGHSAAVDPLLAPLREGLRGLPSQDPTLRCYSTVHDDPRSPSRFDVDHWAANLRNPVRQHQAMAAAMEDGLTVFVELSPHPIALPALERTALAHGGRVTAVATAHRKDGEQRTFLTGLAQLHVLGMAGVLDARPPAATTPVELPGPRFDHERFWPDKPRRRAADGRHPLLGVHVELPDPDGARHAWQGQIGTDEHPWLAGHAVLGSPVLPATAYVEMALVAARTVVGPQAQLRDLELREVLALSADTAVTTTLTRHGEADGRIEVHTRTDEGGWTCHATACVTAGVADPPAAIGPVPADGSAPLDLYAAMRDRGQFQGPVFQSLTSVLVGPGHASAAVDAHVSDTGAADRAMLVHPALADACLQALAAASGLLGSDHGVWVPAGIGTVTVLGEPRRGVRVVARLGALDPDGAGMRGHAQLLDPDDTVLVELADIHARRFDLATLPTPTADPVATPVAGWPGMAVARSRGPVAAAEAITEHTAEIVATLMGHTADRIDRSRPLTELGADSLVAVRARTAVERDFGLSLPVALLLRGASIDEVAAALVDQAGLVATPVPVRPVGPRDPAERWVARRWADVLPGEASTVHEPFGGDPATADRLRAAVIAELGDATGLFDTPTVAGMADLLRERIERGADGPRRVLRAGTGDPLFLFHPAGGPTSVYRELVGRLGGDRPVYGLERFDDNASVQERARRYAELVREARPHGPYHLAGWSFGGCLAYETGRLLHEAGRPVGSVTMFDTARPLPTGCDNETLLRERFARFAVHIEQTYGVAIDVPAGPLATLPDGAQIDAIIDQLAERIPGMGRGVLHHQRTSYVDARAAERYQPPAWPGRVVLLRAEAPHELTTTLDPRYRRSDAALGWDEYCPDIEVVPVAGDHLSMIDPPHVDVLAAALDAVLNTPGETRS